MPAGRPPQAHSLFQLVLIRVRQRYRLTQRELAERVKVTPSAVSQWEKVGRYVGEETLERVADGLGETLSHMLQRELAELAAEGAAAQAAAG